MEVSAVIGRARELLTDEVSVRWLNAELIALFNDFQNDLFKLRPDCRMYEGQIRADKPTALDTAGALTQLISVSDSFKEAGAFYVAAKAFMDDSEHGSNAERAAAYMAEYGRLIS